MKHVARKKGDKDESVGIKREIWEDPGKIQRSV